MTDGLIKRNDLYVLIVTVILAVVLSSIVSRFIFTIDKSKTKVEVVKPINSDFPLPPDTYFNTNSLNPTQQIKIGDSNPKPFN